MGGIMGARRPVHLAVAAIATVALVVAFAAWAGRESATAVVLPLGIVAPVAAGVALLGFSALGGPNHTRHGRRALALAGAAAAGLVLLLGLARLARAPRAVELEIAADVPLAGTLHLPRAGGPHPGVVLVHGSGPETREELRFYADFLARRGVAAVAYDKRGTGASGGDLWASGYADYAADALAVARALAARPEVDPASIGLWGFSEAEWVAPIAAARAPGLVSFLVVVGASGTTPVEQVREEMEQRLADAGHDAGAIAAARDLYAGLVAYERTGEGADELARALAAAQDEPWFADADVFPEAPLPATDLAWWRSVMDFDPAPVWRELSIPVLLLKGARDVHSPAPEVAARFERLGRDLQVVPEADHMLLRWPLGRGTPPPTFAPGYPDLVPLWIRSRAPSEARPRSGTFSEPPVRGQASPPPIGSRPGFRAGLDATHGKGE